VGASASAPTVLHTRCGTNSFFFDVSFLTDTLENNLIVIYLFFLVLTAVLARRRA